MSYYFQFLPVPMGVITNKLRKKNLFHKIEILKNYLKLEYQYPFNIVLNLKSFLIIRVIKKIKKILARVLLLILVPIKFKTYS